MFLTFLARSPFAEELPALSGHCREPAIKLKKKKELKDVFLNIRLKLSTLNNILLAKLDIKL